MNEDHRLLLGGITPAQFLQTYWQKKPCLIRQAMPGFSGFITLQELMQLALDPQVESRIVLERDGEYPWQVVHGPLEKPVFSSLPASHWTLLVQGVNLHHPGAAKLLQGFSFIPNWRIDDLMISYAPDHGSVGPHLDSYDVFLLQGLGRRLWRISTRDYNDSDFLQEADLRIIKSFVPEQQWELEPGDMLYLPPGIAHHGIARGECMTYSIGFRAPSQHELVNRYLGDRYDSAGDTQYQDPDLKVPRYSGEIQRDSLERIVDIMRSSLADSRDIETWFGCHVTTLPEQFIPDSVPTPVDEPGFRKILAKNRRLEVHYATRTAFFHDVDEICLFVNGYCYRMPGCCRNLVIDITGYGSVDCSALDRNVPAECIQVLHDLYNKGILINC